MFWACLISAAAFGSAYFSGFQSESFVSWMTVVSHGRNEASEKYDSGYLPASSALMS